MAKIVWTDAERQAVIAEGLRLRDSGKAPAARLAAFEAAQRVLPKARRRPASNTSHVRWFFDAFDAAPPKGQDGPQSSKQPAPATTLPTPAENAPTAAPSQAGKTKVFWRDREKQALCEEAARILADLEAGSARDALVQAQERVLPPERRRAGLIMSMVSDWYPARLQAAASALNHKREAERAAAAAAAAAAVAQPEPTVAEPVAAVVEPAAVITPATPEPEPVTTAAPPVATAPIASPALASVFGRSWAHLREHLVQEVAGIVAEGILRGLESVRLSAPREQSSSVTTTSTTTENPDPPTVYAQWVEPTPIGGKKTRPPSVLVVGLKGGQVSQIEADFKGTLDLRFCSADQSKDHLRAMTEQAETTVAFVDFLSHSHTDIIKARAKHYIESRGGMTSLRQQLARLAGQPINGHP